MLRGCAVLLCVTSGLCAEDSEKVLAFANTNTLAGYQEVMNAVRSISDVNDARLDREARTLTLRGPANRLALGAWLFQELDRPRDQPAPPNTPMHEFRPEGMGDAVARAYFLPTASTPVMMQEMVNAMRSVADIQRLFPVNAIHAVAMRGTAAEVAMTVWGLGEMEHGTPGEVKEYRPSGVGDVAVRMFFTSHVPTPQALQELVNAVRSVADVQRFFPVNHVKAILMRGTAAQADVCAWLLGRLDGEGPVGAGELVALGGVIKVFPVNVTPVGTLQDLVNRVRAETQAQRVYPVISRSAIVFRGSAAQAGVAARVVGD